MTGIGTKPLNVLKKARTTTLNSLVHSFPNSWKLSDKVFFGGW